MSFQSRLVERGACAQGFKPPFRWCSRQDFNLRLRLRRPVLRATQLRERGAPRRIRTLRPGLRRPRAQPRDGAVEEATGLEPARPGGTGRDRFRGGCDAIPLTLPWVVDPAGIEPAFSWMPSRRPPVGTVGPGWLPTWVPTPAPHAYQACALPTELVGRCGGNGRSRTCTGPVLETGAHPLGFAPRG